MESLGIMPDFWAGKKVFLTGHTGFKGGWLSLWLQQLGADVYGYALNPLTTPDLYNIAGVEDGMASSVIADIRDAELLSEAMQSAQPDIVFHLAAQPLVRYSYKEPIETYSVNIMGTVNLFEAVRNTKSVKAIVNVTSDKCYENQEWIWPYREGEPMGGYDPYSSSKGCAELVTSAYRRSFFTELGIALASARSGNVIGGGDWSEDRLIPDFLRAFETGKPVVIRSPESIRPWQHVLEPLSGYLLLAEKLYVGEQTMAGPWNFGPADQDARSVSWIIQYLVDAIPGTTWKADRRNNVHEANYLKLDSSKAHTLLKWKTRWSLEKALDRVIEWHQQWRSGENMHDCCMNQIAAYCEETGIN